MIAISSEQLQVLAPNARDVYKQAFAKADDVLAKYGINDNALRVAHFMAQMLHESGGLTILVEDLNYRAERLLQVWPKRFPTLESAQPYAHNPEKLANKVYGNRADIGNTQPGDGWRFIGRGILQITGREAYTRYGKRLGIDLVGNPDLAASADWALHIAAEEWTAIGCNKLADQDDLTGVTKKINGGTIGLSSRAEWLVKTKHVWPAA